MDDYVVKFTKNEYEEATKYLVKAICTARIPFAFVENIYFKRFVKILNPCYKLPSRKQVAGPLLEKEYKESKEFIDGIIKITDYITLIIDGWSNVKHLPVLNIVACALSYTPEPILLDSIMTADQSHTAEYMAGLLKKEIENIGSKKVVAVETDNAKAMLSITDVYLINEYPHLLRINCAAHTLNLLIKDICALPWFRKIILGAKNIILEVTRSPLRLGRYEVLMNDYIAEQRRDNKIFTPISLRVFPDVRWQYATAMLYSLRKAKPILVRLVEDGENEQRFALSIHNRNHIRNHDNFWTNIDATYNFLAPFSLGIEKLQSNMATISDVIEIIKDIGEKFNETKSLISSGEQTSILHLIKDRFVNLNSPEYYLANVLDHRYRGERLTVSQKIQANDALKIFAPKFELNSEECSKLYVIYNSFLAQEGVFNEMLFSNKEMSPLKWWSKIGGHFAKGSHLAEIGKILFSIPASTACIERIFPQQSRIHTLERIQLGDEKVKKILVIESANRI